MFHDCEAAAVEEKILADLLKKVEESRPDFTIEELEVLALHPNKVISRKARQSVERQKAVLPELRAFYEAKGIKL